MKRFEMVSYGDEFAVKDSKVNQLPLIRLKYSDDCLMLVDFLNKMDRECFLSEVHASCTSATLSECHRLFKENMERIGNFYGVKESLFRKYKDDEVRLSVLVELCELLGVDVE